MKMTQQTQTQSPPQYRNPPSGESQLLERGRWEVVQGEGGRGGRAEAGGGRGEGGEGERGEREGG